jgi:hypothetical protein
MNSTLDSFDQLDSAAARAWDGLKAHGSAVGVKQTTAAVLETALRAARQAEAAFQTSYVKRHAEISRALKAADADADAFLSRAKRILKLSLGDTWSPRWAEVGFVSGTIRTPRPRAEREALLLAVARHLETVTDRQVPAVDVTAARARTVHAALAAARAAATEHEVAHRRLKDARVTALTTLRKRLRALRAELDVLLASDDPRWSAFGMTSRTERSRTTRTATRKGTRNDGSLLSVVPDPRSLGDSPTAAPGVAAPSLAS